MDTIRLCNEIVKADIKKTGAELCRITNAASGKNYLWDPNPKIWQGYAPILFPVVGALKEGCYLLDGEKYFLPQHGFARNNPDFKLISSCDTVSSFMLRHNQSTLKQYPFQFEFIVTYELTGNRIVVGHTVKNINSKDMYFSLGVHPAFRCPVLVNEYYSDYFIEFEYPETCYTHEIHPGGLIGEQADLILDNSKKLDLHYDLFSKGALVLKHIKSKKVSLCSSISGKQIGVDFEGFPYLGIWAKPKADYVCIEPWMGIADSVDTDQNFISKEGIIRLAAKDSFNASYSITLF